MKNQKEELEFEMWQEKTHKRWIMPTTIILLIILLFGGYYYYFYVYFNTEKALDGVKDNLTNVIETNINKFIELIEDHSLDNPNKLDGVRDGKLSIKYKSEDILSLDYKLISSPSKYLMSLDIDTTFKKEHLLKGNIFFQDDKVILKSPDISEYSFEALLGNDSFELSPYDSSLNDVNYLITKLVGYHIEALKEADLVTKPNGFLKRQYSVTVNSSNKGRVINRFKELIKEDKKLTKIIEYYELKVEEYTFIDSFELAVDVGVFDNKIKSFVYSDNDTYLEGTYDGEKYIIKDTNNDYAHVWINSDEFKIEIYENKVMTAAINIEIQNGYKIYIMYNKKTLTLNYENNTLDFIYNDIENNEKVELNLVEKYEEGKIISTGTGSYKSEIETLEITYKEEVYLQEKSLERIDDSKTRSIDTLTEAEMNEIYTNLYKIFDKLGLYNNVGSNEGV